MKKGKVIIQLTDGELEYIGKIGDVEIVVANLKTDDVPHLEMTDYNIWEGGVQDIVEWAESYIADDKELIDYDGHEDIKEDLESIKKNEEILNNFKIGW